MQAVSLPTQMALVFFGFPKYPFLRKKWADQKVQMCGCRLQPYTYNDVINLLAFGKTLSWRRTVLIKLEGPRISKSQLSTLWYAASILRISALRQRASCQKLWNWAKKVSLKGQCYTNSVWEARVTEEENACSGIPATKKKGSAYKECERLRVS